jgi:hypothetical protein
MKIKLVLFKPDIPRFRILDSYLEVIASLEWGFTQLGHECSSCLNAVDTSCVNIVFGWIPALLNGNVFPPGTILYNLEQFSNQTMRGQRVLEVAAQHYQIWDYSAANIQRWMELVPRFPVFLAPISYAPSLTRVAATASEDIDILYIGSLGPKRAEKIISVGSTQRQSSVVTLSNVWDRQRDTFISRAKLLLNVSNENPLQTIFEIVRVSYYLANRKAVICEQLPTMSSEDDMRSTLLFVTPDQLASTCDEYLEDVDKRRTYAQAGFEIFRQRDVRIVLQSFFGS